MNTQKPKRKVANRAASAQQTPTPLSIEEGASSPPTGTTEAAINQRRFEELLKATVTLAQQIGSYAVIGGAIGFVVLFVYCVGRNALPEFRGDEWIAQLVQLGFFCSFFVAVFAAIPSLDLAVHTTAYGSFTDQNGWIKKLDSSALKKTHAHQVNLQALWGVLTTGFFLGSISLLAYFHPVVPIWATIAILSSVTILAALLHGCVYIKQAKRFRMKQVDVFAICILCGCGYSLNMLVLLAMSEVISSLYSVHDDLSYLGLLVGLGVVLAAYRWIYQIAMIAIAFQRERQVRSVLVLTAVLTLGLAVFSPPAVMRMTAMGNLPHASITLEAPLACKVLKHLHAEEWKAAQLNVEQKNAEPLKFCQQSSKDLAGELLTFKIDVVSRVGSSYIVAKAGDLGKFSNGQCNRVHSAVDSSKSADNKNKGWFACAEFSRDTNKLGLR